MPNLGEFNRDFPIGFVVMTDALFESVLLRMMREWRAIRNEEQQNWPKMRRQHTNSAAGAPTGKSRFNML